MSELVGLNVPLDTKWINRSHRRHVYSLRAENPPFLKVFLSIAIYPFSDSCDFLEFEHSVFGDHWRWYNR